MKYFIKKQRRDGILTLNTLSFCPETVTSSDDAEAIAQSSSNRSVGSFATSSPVTPMTTSAFSRRLAFPASSTTYMVLVEFLNAASVREFMIQEDIDFVPTLAKTACVHPNICRMLGDENQKAYR